MLEQRRAVTYMAECFWPNVREETVEQAAGRIRQSAADVTRDGDDVELSRTILVPGDEVVFYLFTGSADAVREACERAEVAFERVLEAIELEQPSETR